MAKRRGITVEVIQSTEPIDLDAWARDYVAWVFAAEERHARNEAAAPDSEPRQGQRE
jgi:hypothetical protein